MNHALSLDSGLLKSSLLVLAGLPRDPQSQARGWRIGGRFGSVHDGLLRTARLPRAEPPAVQTDDGRLRRFRTSHGSESKSVRLWKVFSGGIGKGEALYRGCNIKPLRPFSPLAMLTFHNADGVGVGTTTNARARFGQYAGNVGMPYYPTHVLCAPMPPVVRGQQKWGVVGAILEISGVSPRGGHGSIGSAVCTMPMCLDILRSRLFFKDQRTAGVELWKKLMWPLLLVLCCVDRSARCSGPRSRGRTDTCVSSPVWTSKWSSRSTTTRCVVVGPWCGASTFGDCPPALAWTVFLCQERGVEGVSRPRGVKTETDQVLEL